MIEIRRILCPTDFSEFSRLALDHAVALSRWYGAEIETLHVVHQVVPHPSIVPTYPAWAALDPAVREQLTAELHRFAEPAVKAGIPARVALREGDTVSEVLEEARTFQADLVVMGTHGRGGFERWVLGSVTEKVLRKAACPVLTVRLPEKPPQGAPLYRRILCPLDFSGASTHALRYALSLAQEADAQLTLLHVLESLPDEEPVSLPSVPDYRRFLEGEARERLRVAVPAEERDWCKPEEVVVTGRAWRRIVGEAIERQTELIVMGVHGRSAFDVMLFGSATHHVVRAAPCPVLTIRAPR